ncbi:MAG: pyridoxal-5'-phosphate-dependent protein [Proteobacteria bacterium]|jgi:Threonine dehydratase|nr:MAG: pyridoxal-5'-phosphate-dependent protein [Pseudomonadota bacterium]
MELRLPTYDDVLAASERLGNLSVRTPLIENPVLNDRAGGRVLLKLETLQRVGAFKFRGAYNAISQLDRSKYPGGVVACSSGNHAQGVAAAAMMCGMSALIVMPKDAPALKISRTKSFGAEVVTYDRETEDRDAIALALCAERNAAFIPPFDHFDVIAGQGTVGLELMQQADMMGARPEAVVAPCSGGGLITGIALAVKHASPDTEVYCAEPEGFDDFTRSLASGRRERNTKMTGSICDALLAPTPGELTFEIAKKNLAGGAVVSEEEVRSAIRFAFQELKLVVEPGGAAGLAAVLSGKLPAYGRTIACVLSGGNVDPALYTEIING